MEENHAPILLFSQRFLVQQASERESLSLRGSDHCGHLDKETILPEAALEIGGPGLRLGKKRDSYAAAEELRRQFKFGKRGLSDAVVVVRQPPDETAEPKMARLIRAMTVQCRPAVVKVL